MCPAGSEKGHAAKPPGYLQALDDLAPALQDVAHLGQQRLARLQDAAALLPAQPHALLWQAGHPACLVRCMTRGLRVNDLPQVQKPNVKQATL